MCPYGGRSQNKGREARNNAWILEAMWRFVETRVSMRRDPSQDQSLMRHLGRAINSILKADRRWRTGAVGGEIYMLLIMDPPLHKESWHQIKGWHKSAVNHAPPPARGTLGQITSERIALYRQLQPPGENIALSMDTFPVKDLVPIEYNIYWAVRRLRIN